CNLEQGTESFADEDRKMSYNSNWDKAKNILNNELLPNATQFDMSGSHRSKTLEYQLQDFKQKVKQMTLESAKKLHNSMVSNGRRYLNGDDSYEIYYRKCMIIQEVFRL
ncbi:MAG: hypothetical protein HOL90_06225, partial [Candidatus Nitrosopelagicus sp.]|nr:hypothetical protein [Candidatus Nitrosopelagicus sp.]